jgi:hypothetical protein
MPGDGLLRKEREGSVHITLPTRIEFSEIDHGLEPSVRKLVCDLTRQTIFWQELVWRQFGHQPAGFRLQLGQYQQRTATPLLIVDLIKSMSN